MIAVISSLASSPPPVRPPRCRWWTAAGAPEAICTTAALSGPAIIGVSVDGYFERVPTVWHKEILTGRMAQGIHVYGAASIGALRAAELTELRDERASAMSYRQFQHQPADGRRRGTPVLHGPAEVGYVQVTEAMVNVRATIDRALQLGRGRARVRGERCSDRQVCVLQGQDVRGAIPGRRCQSRGSRRKPARFASRAWLPGEAKSIKSASNLRVRCCGPSRRILAGLRRDRRWRCPTSSLTPSLGRKPAGGRDRDGAGPGGARLAVTAEGPGIPAVDVRDG